MVVDFGKIQNVADRGINRAAVFMGFGVNAADDPSLTNYHPRKDTGFQLLPESIEESVLSDWKNEFRVWVVGGGFREMVDNICVFLDRIHEVCRLIDLSSSAEILNKFHRKGIGGKLLDLNQHLKIGTPNDEQIASFGPIRNCFVHRLGRVGDDDLKEVDTIILRFFRFNSMFKSISSDKPVLIPDIFDPNSPPFYTEEGGHLRLQWTEKILSFTNGELIKISPKDLIEILFFTREWTKGITRSALKFAKSKGVILDEGAEKAIE